MGAWAARCQRRESRHVAGRRVGRPRDSSLLTASLFLLLFVRSNHAVFINSKTQPFHIEASMRLGCVLESTECFIVGIYSLSVLHTT